MTAVASLTRVPVSLSHQNILSKCLSM